MWGEWQMVDETKQCPFCGEDILAVAIKCKHCNSMLSDHPASATPESASADFGWIILGIPVAAALLIVFWLGGMSLIQFPGDKLMLVVMATVIGTAAVVAIEAAKLHMRTDRAKGSYSPTAWFILVALLWIVGYPAYLLKRSDYGLQNRLWAGIGAALIFLGSVVLIQFEIEQSKEELRKNINDVSKALENPMGAIPDRSDQAGILRDYGIAAQVAEGIVLAGALKDEMSEYFAKNGSWPRSLGSGSTGLNATEPLRGDFVTNISTTGVGDINITYGNNADANIAGRTLGYYVVVIGSNRDTIQWICGHESAPNGATGQGGSARATTIPTRYLPAECQPGPALADSGSSDTNVTSERSQDSGPSSSGGATEMPTQASAGAATAPTNYSSAETSASPSMSPSFDCAKAATNVEKMICANSSLAEADADLAMFYRQNLEASGAGTTSLRQSQRAFIVKRDQCSSEECVAEAYRARWEEIVQLGYVRQ
jgi:uncharacterized protein YecT (DUF1311 family)